MKRGGGAREGRRREREVIKKGGAGFMTDDYYYVILSPTKIGIPPKLYLEPAFTNQDNLLVWNYIFNKSDVISNLYDIYKEGGASFIFSRKEIHPLPRVDQPPTNNEPDEPPWLPAEVAASPSPSAVSIA